MCEERTKKAMISHYMVDGETLFIVHVIYKYAMVYNFFLFYCTLPTEETLMAFIFTYGTLNIYHRHNKLFTHKFFFISEKNSSYMCMTSGVKGELFNFYT